MHRPSLVLVTPALADANNGNWQTARRWARLLRTAYRVEVVGSWPSQRAGPAADLMLALHARRSAASIAAWREAHPQRPLVVVLTGTDLYRDIDVDASAQRSLALADALVVLNTEGAARLPTALRGQAHVVLPSCSARRKRPRTDRHLQAVAVGHLRAEKDPATLWRAMQRLAHRPDIRLVHLGGVLEPALGDAASATAAALPAYRWLGAVPHAQARRRIQAAHLLVHPSVMEGGAHVVMEAVRSGTPVLASRIDGNLGLLGPDYPGYFEPGDDVALAALLQRMRDDPAMLPRLQAAAEACAPRFAPEAEFAALQAVLAPLLRSQRPRACSACAPHSLSSCSSPGPASNPR